MAELDAVSEEPIDGEDKKKSPGCLKRFLIWAGVIVGLSVIITFMIPDSAGTPRATRTPASTPGPTPTWEEWKASAEEIPYKTLFRYAEENKGKRVFYRGVVVQVIEDEGDFRLRVNVTPGDYGFWTDTVYLRYADAPVRVLEEDIISFVGRMNGTVTYESIMGAEITIPYISVGALIIETE